MDVGHRRQLDLILADETHLADKIREEVLVTGSVALPGAQVVQPATLNQALIRFRREGNTPDQDDALTDTVIEKVNATGEAFFSGTTWHGRRTMRVSVVNWRTSVRDVERAIAAVGTVLFQVHGPDREAHV